MAQKPSPGAPAWLVTFADLMSLLVCFFVLIISFSVPDTEKLKIAAGSIRDAFGFTREIVVTGVVELEGNPIYKFAQDLQLMAPEDVVGPIPDIGRELRDIAAFEDRLEESEARDQASFERIEAELQEAIETTPELAGLAANLHVERTPEGLRIQLLDQARMSMFPLGSAAMYEPTRVLLAKVAKAIQALPNEVEIAGHTDAHGFRRRDGYDNWSLSLDRADATRKVLAAAGLSERRIAAVTGRADTQHMVPDDPLDPRNRRISITLLRSRPAHGTGGSGQGRGAPPAPEPPRERNSLYSIAPRL